MAVYRSWVQDVFTEWLAGAAVKALLVDSAYVPDEAHEFRAAITGEVAGTGYTAGGAAVTGVTVAVGTGVVTITCDDVDFGEIELAEVAGIVFYADTGAAATDDLLAVDLFDPVEVSDAVKFIYRPPASGLVAATIGATS